MNFDSGNFDENFDVHQFRKLAFFRFITRESYSYLGLTLHPIMYCSTDLLPKNPVLI